MFAQNHEHMPVLFKIPQQRKKGFPGSLIAQLGQCNKIQAQRVLKLAELILAYFSDQIVLILIIPVKGGTVDPAGQNQLIDRDLFKGHSFQQSDHLGLDGFPRFDHP
jgi:hypothetical protein